MLKLSFKIILLSFVKLFLKMFSLKPFLKRLAVKQFFEKACRQTIFKADYRT